MCLIEVLRKGTHSGVEKADSSRGCSTSPAHTTQQFGRTCVSLASTLSACNLTKFDCTSDTKMCRSVALASTNEFWEKFDMVTVAGRAFSQKVSVSQFISGFRIHALVSLCDVQVEGHCPDTQDRPHQNKKSSFVVARILQQVAKDAFPPRTMASCFPKDMPCKRGIG